MSNSICLNGPPFSITGNTSLSGLDFSFSFEFDKDADRNEVRLFEWYLDGELMLGYDVQIVAGTLSCGDHTIGGRILTADGWSGVNELLFQTCARPQTLNISGEDTVEEGDSATYQVLGTYADGVVKDLTSDYIFTCTAGEFAGATLTVPPNGTPGDTRTATITATKSGETPITKQITIVDTTVPLSVYIDGPDEVDEGSSATFYVRAKYGDGTILNQTDQYAFTCTEGQFNGSTLTISPNGVPNDNRQALVTAKKAGSPDLSKPITIIDKTLPILIIIDGPASVGEGSSAAYHVIATYGNGTTADLSTSYTYSCTEGVFEGLILSVPANDVPHDTRAATISASLNEGVPLTKQITIVDTTQPVSFAITGPDTVDEGGSATYHVIATYGNGTTDDLSSEYNFWCTEGDGNFDDNILHVQIDNIPNNTRAATVYASYDGGEPLTKNITIINTTQPASFAISGPSSVNEGDSATYQVIATYANGTTADFTAQYIFTSTVGTFSGAVLTIPTNTTAGDSRLATITASRSGFTSLTKQISVLDTTNVLGVLVVDIYNVNPLDVIAFIDNAEVAENHQAAHTGANIIPASVSATFAKENLILDSDFTSQAISPSVKDALILASDFINQTTLNWRFEFNIGKLVTNYPGTANFVFYIKGRGSVAQAITGTYVTKQYKTNMTLSGSPGTYIPSTDGNDAIITQTYHTNVVAGRNGDFTESVLTNILKLVYNTASKTVSVTTYPIATP